MSDLNRNDLEIVKGILHYLYDPIDWQFSRLTPKEREVVQDQPTLDRLRQWAEGSSDGTDR